MWVIYSLMAALLFAICDATISEISVAGPKGILYFCLGTLVCGIVFFAYRFRQNYVNKGVFWVDFRFKVDGTLNMVNMIGFLIFALIYGLYQNLAVTCFYFTNKAGINVGVMTTIWSINPLFIAVLDYLIYK